MENKKTHWRKYDNPNYLGAYSLMDGQTRDLKATIEKVVNETVKNERGDDNCRVAYLKGQKPMILNTTNSKILERNFGTPYIEDWAGKQITIYVAKIKAFGDEMECLRIKKQQYKKLPELSPKDKEKWNAAIEALKGNYTIDQIKTKYSLSPENQEKLIAEAI
jgi:hypothetical protein